MEILKLEVNNFLTIGNATLELNDKGLVLIKGVNDDDPSALSNGSGKSSIADSLCWGLFGETARGSSGDSVVNRKAKANTSVKIVLQDGETIYEITRYRKDKTHKNSTFVHSWTKADYASGAIMGLPMHKGTERETQAVIHDVLGCTIDVFAASIYAGQEVMPDLPKMTDKDLKSLLERASGVERLEKAYTIAKADALAAEKDVATAASLRESVVTRRSYTETNIRETAAKYKLFEDTRPDRAAKINAAIVDHEKNIEIQESKITTGPDLVKLQAAYDSLGVKIGEIDTMRGEHRKLTDVYISENGQLATLNAKLNSATVTVRAIERQIENAAEEMKKPCPECGKPHTEAELDEYIEHAKKRLNDAKVAQEAAQTAVTAQLDIVHKAKTKADDYEATIPSSADLVEKQNKIKAAIDAVQSNIKLRDKWREDVVQFKIQQANIMSEPNPFKESIVELKKHLDADIESVKKAEAAYLEKEQIHLTKVKIAEVFSPAGVRAHILDTITPFLNDRTADYLSALSDGSISALWSTLSETKSGELREKFTIEVTNDKGADDFTGLSGGEKRKVRLATMLALQDLVSSRAVKPINLWIGDEIDHALDTAALERLMAIVERKARERGTVLVISHNDLSDWIDQQVTVTKKDGQSTVEGVLCP